MKRVNMKNFSSHEKMEDQTMSENCFDCSTCRYRYIHFPGMDDFGISMQECRCDGEDYEEEQ